MPKLIDILGIRMDSYVLASWWTFAINLFPRVGIMQMIWGQEFSTPTLKYIGFVLPTKLIMDNIYFTSESP